MPLLVATAIGGGSGYILMVVAGVSLSAGDYAVFAVFWSALYLVISALLGVQQEVARAVGPAASPGEESASAPRTLLRFGVVAAIGTGAVVAIALSSLQEVLSIGSPAYAAPLAVASASYVALAVFSGVASGLAQWRVAASVTIVDACLRLALVLIAFAADASAITIGWAIAVPLPTTLVLVALVVRGVRAARYTIDVAAAQLWRNAARTVLGGAAMGAMISGLPLLMDLLSRDVAEALFASMIFTVTVARAPLIIVVMALQSYLVVTMRKGVRPRALVTLFAALGALAVALGLAGALVGPPLLQLAFPGSPALAPVSVGLVVASGGLVAMMCITGALCLARSHHSTYVAGWLAAAVATVALLGLPIGFVNTVVVALMVSPLTGILIHLVGLVMLRARNQSSADS